MCHSKLLTFVRLILNDREKGERKKQIKKGCHTKKTARTHTEENTRTQNKVNEAKGEWDSGKLHIKHHVRLNDAD